MRNLTGTHYAVLGLLAQRPWSTYELVRYLRTSNLRVIWTKTEARLYETPRELVEAGLATARKERISQETGTKGRERTIYTISRSGRAALRAWLKEPPQPASIAIESLLKLSFGEQGTLDDFIAQIAYLQEAIVSSATPERLRAAADSPQLPARHHISARIADLSDRVGWVVFEWLDELRTDAADWDTIASSPERLEEAKALYKRIGERTRRRMRRYSTSGT